MGHPPYSHAGDSKRYNPNDPFGPRALSPAARLARDLQPLDHLRCLHLPSDKFSAGAHADGIIVQLPISEVIIMRFNLH